MPELKDVGGGFKMMDLSQEPRSDVLQQAQQQLGLIDLVNRVRQAPLDTAIKEADKRIKQYQASDEYMQMDRIKRATEVSAAISKENRDKSSALLQQMDHVQKTFREVGFDAGKYVAEEFARTFNLPKPFIKQNDAGVVSIVMPGFAPIKIETKALTDIKDINAETEKQLENWKALTKEYGEVYNQRNSALSQLRLGTGFGDRGAAYSWAKMKDPTGSVREGDYESVMKSPGLSQSFKNQFESWFRKDGAIFGDQGSPTRQAFEQAINSEYQTRLNSVLPAAQHFPKSLVRGVDPRRVIQPVGELTHELILGIKKEQKPMPPQTTPQEQIAEPKPETNSTRVPQQKKPSAQFDSLMNGWLQKMMQGGKSNVR